MIARYFYVLLFCIGLVACSDQRDRFVGTWNNGGTGNLVISKQGDNLLFQQTITQTGQIFMSNGAHVEGGYLTVDDNVLFKKISYSDDDKGLIVLNIGEHVPTYHLISQANFK